MMIRAEQTNRRIPRHVTTPRLLLCMEGKPKGKHTRGTVACTSCWWTHVRAWRWMGSASCRRFARPCPLPAHRDPRKTASCPSGVRMTRTRTYGACGRARTARPRALRWLRAFQNTKPRRLYIRGSTARPHRITASSHPIARRGREARSEPSEGCVRKSSALPASRTPREKLGRTLRASWSQLREAVPSPSAT